MLQLSRGTGRARPSREGPEDLLLACHERIRRFSALAVALVDSDAPSRELAEAAELVHRYFSVALPLHVADEDLSLRKALLEAAPTPSVVAALETMTREHGEHGVLLEDLIPCWAALARDPRLAGSLRPRLAAARRLDVLVRDHLALEEGVIFPAIAGLSAAAADVVLGDMKARRRAPAAP